MRLDVEKQKGGAHVWFSGIHFTGHFLPSTQLNYMRQSVEVLRKRDGLHAQVCIDGATNSSLFTYLSS